MLGTNNVKANATMVESELRSTDCFDGYESDDWSCRQPSRNSGIVEINETEDEDFFALPDTIEKTEYELDASRELIGARDSTSKTFVNEDGDL